MSAACWQEASPLRQNLAQSVRSLAPRDATCRKVLSRSRHSSAVRRVSLLQAVADLQSAAATIAAKERPDGREDNSSGLAAPGICQSLTQHATASRSAVPYMHK